MFKRAIEDLNNGKNTVIKPHGNSMRGKIESGNTVTLAPCKIKELKVGKIVLVKVKGHIYLHLIKAIKKDKNKTRFQIGNNVGGVNGWVGPNAIYGEVIKIEK